MSRIDELEILNRLGSGYFEIAEMQAMKHKPMYMSDYVDTLDNILKSTGEEVLKDAGNISHKQAMEKALSEYRKYQTENLSPVEKDYLAEIKNIEKIAKEGGKDEQFTSKKFFGL
ncbi:RhuM family protein [Bulleidia sp. zg-1006]|uniref:RhuM family protein n=1 Tax=Bulleidia sp. zg-1006 TaxID=2806552 RepID=UPI00193A0361|nr:RhuM family protein [Bulleidia sp. zg-1006]QRG86500.1 virulence RhuM family protein [Bulleidia sp. zg-1006]